MEISPIKQDNNLSQRALKNSLNFLMICDLILNLFGWVQIIC